MNPHRLLCLAALLACCTVDLSAPAAAAELHWRNRPYQIVAENKRLTDFLRELAAAQGVTAVVDSKIDATISGRFSGSPASTLNTVCATYGLTWYYDGSFLYIDRAEEAQTQVFPIPKGSAEQVGQVLQSMQITDKRFPLLVSDKDSTVYVSGPRRYVELVKQSISSVGDGAHSGERAEIRAFPLKYAWATDFQVNRSGRSVTVPGIATILRRLYGQGSSTSSTSAAPRLGSATRQVKLGQGAMLSIPRIDTSNYMEPPADSGPPLLASNGPGPDLPRIEPDPGINSVVIRDLPERLAQYQKVISSLDIRPRLVEISLTIIDISADSLDSLGVDWRLHTTHGDFQSGNGQNPPLTFSVGSTEQGSTGPSTPNGIALTASIGGSLRNYLLARINALTQSGNAQTQAKPKVLALDNTEAILENLTQFYIPVSGFQDSSLYTVQAGTSVKVTPLVVDENGNKSVMLSISIDDGNVTQDTVQNLPVIQQRAIVTQAMVEEGKSLLIAGFNADEQRFTKSGVPLLSDIPILGNLFKYTTKSGKHMERFYLLTPRLATTPFAEADVPAFPQPMEGPNAPRPLPVPSSDAPAAPSAPPPPTSPAADQPATQAPRPVATLLKTPYATDRLAA